MADMHAIRSTRATRQRYKKGRRDKVVRVRMNDEELSLLDEQRGTSSRSNYLRGGLYYGSWDVRPRRVVVSVLELDRVRLELNRIGVNVNQIARARNEHIGRLGMLEAAKYQVNTKDEAKALDKVGEELAALRYEVEGLRGDLQRREDVKRGDA